MPGPRPGCTSRISSARSTTGSMPAGSERSRCKPASPGTKTQRHRACRDRTREGRPVTTKNAVPTTQCIQDQHRRHVPEAVGVDPVEGPVAHPEHAGGGSKQLCDTLLRFSESSIFSPERPRNTEGMGNPGPGRRKSSTSPCDSSTGNHAGHRCSTTSLVRFHLENPARSLGVGPHVPEPVAPGLTIRRQPNAVVRHGQPQ